MTSYERIVVDLQTARRMVQDAEKDRKDLVYWDDGYWWEEAFNELITYEQEYTERLIEAINAIPFQDDKATFYSRQLNRALIEGIDWHIDFRQGLSQTLAQWNTTDTISNSARYRLITHIVSLDVHIFSQDIQLKQVRLEQLERRRRHVGNIDSNNWNQSWDELNTVVDEQRQFYAKTYQIAVPEHIIGRHIVWLKHICDIQEETLQQWQEYRNVNTPQLQQNLRMVESRIKELQPQQHNSWLGCLLAGLIGIVLCIISLYGLSGLTAASSSPLRGQVAVPITTTLPNDPQLLNDQGILLLKDGQCDTAIEHFDAAISAKPEWYEPFNNKAFCLYDEGRIVEAKDAWRAALALEPQSPDANAGLGMVLYSLGNAHEASQHYSVAIGLRPEYVNEEWLRNEAWWSEQAIEASRPLRVALGE